MVLTRLARRLLGDGVATGVRLPGSRAASGLRASTTTALMGRPPAVSPAARRRLALTGLLLAGAASFVLVSPGLTSASAQPSRHPRQLSFAVAKSRSKWLAQHVCEDIDSPAPCHAVGVEGCRRLAPRKIECGVAVRFPGQHLDCRWTMYVYYRHGELTQSEGRSECEATSSMKESTVQSFERP